MSKTKRIPPPPAELPRWNSIVVGPSRVCQFMRSRDPAREIAAGAPWEKLICGKPSVEGKSFCRDCIIEHKLFTRPLTPVSVPRSR